MCYEKKSSASQDKKTAMDRTGQEQARRTETVDALLRDARKEEAKPSPAEAPAREAAPAK